MQGAGIGFGVNGDGADAHLPAGAEDTDSDFAAVGDKDFGDGGGFGHGLHEFDGGILTQRRKGTQSFLFCDLASRWGVEMIPQGILRGTKKPPILASLICYWLSQAPRIYYQLHQKIQRKKRCVRGVHPLTHLFLWDTP